MGWQRLCLQKEINRTSNPVGPEKAKHQACGTEKKQPEKDSLHANRDWLIGC